MSSLGILIILFAAGVLLLVAEVFIPSHGVLCIAGLGFLVAGVARTFEYGGREAGVAAIFACVVFVPALAVVAIKYWPRTPIGRRIAPPNPQLTIDDAGVPLEKLASLVGRTGRSSTPLRPVGICDFDGQRVSCLAEFGMIEAGVTVRATGVSGSNLAVQEAKA